VTDARRPDDPELKARHRAMWASGDFPKVSVDTVGEVGPALVQAAGVKPADRVLDVAAGSGNAAIPAAQAGASVVASDLTPELFDAGRARAADVGVELEWVEADAEALPFADASFDVVLSSFGAMFAPRQQVVADELVRVTRPGGTIAMANWTPAGAVGQFFLTMAQFMPPPPPGFAPPALWGDEQHVRSLFADRVEDLRLERRIQLVKVFADPAELVAYYRENFGPTIVAYANTADDPERRAALEEAFLDYATRLNVAAPGERALYEFEYLLVLARRAS
jgi:2-polyprenyl-6-hydroxyphenyl methylase/3-demethylubiquinone-9 3-methyltransferase